MWRNIKFDAARFQMKKSSLRDQTNINAAASSDLSLSSVMSLLSLGCAVREKEALSVSPFISREFSPGEKPVAEPQEKAEIINRRF